MSASESYESLSLAFKALGGGLWEYDIDSDLISCNPRWYEILGIDASATPIRRIEDFRPHIHPEDVQRATEVDIEKVARWLENDEIYHVDFRIIRPDGKIRWVRSVACLVRDPATNHRRAVGCLTDVTELRLQSQLPEVSQPASLDDHADGGVEQLSLLTRRERECLMWVSLGKTAAETAAILGKSPRTVEFHLNNCIRKLGATNKVHATAIAIRRSLI